MSKKKSKKSSISDPDLKRVLERRLSKNPAYYLLFIKTIVDSAPALYTENEILSPTDSPLIPELLRVDTRSVEVAMLSDRDLKARIKGTAQNPPISTNRVIIQNDSIDVFFYPCVRKLLRGLLESSFNENLIEGERKDATRKLKLAFSLLRGRKRGARKGSKRGISSYNEEEMYFLFEYVNRTCKEILKNYKYKAARSMEVRKALSCSDGKSALLSEAKIMEVLNRMTGKPRISSDALVNIIFSVKYACSERAITEALKILRRTQAASSKMTIEQFNKFQR